MKKAFNKPKYTILLPTRNGGEYLPFAIDSVLSQNCDDIELIVSDNYSTDDTSKYLATLTDHRLKIVKPSEELSMSNHYEFILTQATGEWVTILGDDDAAMPYLFERLDSFIEDYPDIPIISSKRAYYYWHGVEDIYGDVVVNYNFEVGAKIRSTKKDLLYALVGLRSCFDMPMVYTTCIVKRKLVNSIIKKSGGYFFHSIIPDMYSVIALSLSTDLYLRVEEPLFWVGSSNKSMAISDRIYNDSEINYNPNIVKANINKNIVLNESISQELHSAGFSSYYLYEALKQCPFPHKIRDGGFLKAAVYSSLIVVADNSSYKAKNCAAKFIVTKINYEIKKNDISIPLVSFFSWMLKGIKMFRSIKSLPKRIWAKSTKRWVNYSICSNNREDFPSIKVASEKVKNLTSVR